MHHFLEQSINKDNLSTDDISNQKYQKRCLPESCTKFKIIFLWLNKQWFKISFFFSFEETILILLNTNVTQLFFFFNSKLNCLTKWNIKSNTHETHLYNSPIPWLFKPVQHSHPAWNNYQCDNWWFPSDHLSTSLINRSPKQNPLTTYTELYFPLSTWNYT